MSAADRLDDAAADHHPVTRRGADGWHWWEFGDRRPCWCGHPGTRHARPPTGCDDCGCQAYSPLIATPGASSVDTPLAKFGAAAAAGIRSLVAPLLEIRRPEMKP
jgi:hypothetical protein